MTTDTRCEFDMLEAGKHLIPGRGFVIQWRDGFAIYMRFDVFGQRVWDVVDYTGRGNGSHVMTFHSAKDARRFVKA